MSSHASHGRAPLRTVQVLGGGSAGSGAHVRSLTGGLVARGVRVTVCAPDEVERVHGFTELGARHVPLPRGSDPSTLATLRAACADADLVHAHGLNAAWRTALALGGRRVPLVVTWHTRAQAEGARKRWVRLLEGRVVRAASVVLGTSTELVDRARRRGARDARLAAVALPAGRRPGGIDGCGADEAERERLRSKVRAELGAVDRPLLLCVGPLEEHRGHGTLLDAAHAWLDLDPMPLVVVVGEGTRRQELRRRAEREGLPVRFAGQRDDVPDILAAADVVVLPSRWESRPLSAQAALRAGVPLVASRAGGIPELVGDGADLVPYGDAPALARAVTRLLTDTGHRERLRERGGAQAAGWPSEDDTVAQVLSVYDELTLPDALH